MTSGIYYKLRERLNEYSIGFASTESEVELKILEKVFTEEEADMYLNLTRQLQSAGEIAETIGRDPDEVEEILQRMTEKGHTFPRFPKKKNEPFYYTAAPWMHGIWEHKTRKMDKDLAVLIEEHFLAGPVTRGPIGFRNIPVNAAVDDATTIAPYDNVRSIILEKERISITDCACYDFRKALGENCEQHKEVCMMFDFYAQYYVDRGMGRWITKDEALSKLEEFEKSGLVHQFANSEKPEALCNCCPDCCQGLLALKKMSDPARVAATNYFAVNNRELCTRCLTCMDRCPMDAITMSPDDVAAVDTKRCIGCGLCVSTCTGNALSLKLKPVDQRVAPPPRGNMMIPSKEVEGSIKPVTSIKRK